MGTKYTDWYHQLKKKKKRQELDILTYGFSGETPPARKHSSEQDLQGIVINIKGGKIF